MDGPTQPCAHQVMRHHLNMNIHWGLALSCSVPTPTHPFVIHLCGVLYVSHAGPIPVICSMPDVESGSAPACSLILEVGHGAS